MTQAALHAADGKRQASSAAAELALEHVVERVRALLLAHMVWLSSTREQGELVSTRSSAAFRAFAERDARVAKLLALAEDSAAVLRTLPDSPSERVCEMFAVDALERDLLHFCLALELEPGLCELVERLSGVRFVTDALAAQLFGHGYRTLYSLGGALSRWEIVSEADAPAGEPRALVLDTHVRALLLGSRCLDPLLWAAASEPVAREPLAGWPVDELAERLLGLLKQGQRVRLIVHGREGSGRRTFLACVAARLGVRLLALDTSQVSDSDHSRFFLHAQRQAVLEGVALLWHGARAGRAAPVGVAQIPLQMLSVQRGADVQRAVGVVDVTLSFPEPSLEERARLLAQLVPASAGFAPADREHLATRVHLTIGQLATLGERSPASGEQARELARELTRPSLGELGTLLATPYDFNDLIVAPAVREGLRDLCFEAAERSALWANPAVSRLYARGAGLVALLCGPPGTGKTMAAQVIARELGLDLLRIDLAGVASKFIGETAKNLRRIFEAAADAHAILLFDEADALFTRRTDVRDAHDRHANTDTNYLLQLIEDYRGLAILASNQRQHIDPAFVRRIRYVFELARPERSERLALWRGLVSELVSPGELEALERPLEALAATLDLSGAQIKQALLSALFVARREQRGLAALHLVRGVERELEKEGRALTPGERERLLHHG